MVDMSARDVDEGPGYLRLDFDRLALPQQLRLPDLGHNEVVQLGDFNVAIWLDRVRGVMTVWGPGVRDWYATASRTGDLQDALLSDDEPSL